MQAVHKHDVGMSVTGWPKGTIIRGRRVMWEDELTGPSRGARDDGGPGSVAVWRELLRMTARFQTTYVVYVNRVGFEDGLNFGGGSMVVDPFGREAVSLEPLEPGLAVVDLRDARLAAESHVGRQERVLAAIICGPRA